MRWLWMIALYAAAGGPSATVHAQAPETPPAAGDGLSEAQLPTLELSVQPEGEIPVGDAITVRVNADAPAGTRVRVPEQSLDGFDMLGRDAPPPTRLPDGRERHVFELKLMRFEPGDVTLPALELRVVAPDGTVGEMHTEPRTLSVRSRVGNEPNAAPRDATPPVQVMEDDYTLLWVAGGVLAGALLAALGYGYARHRANLPAAPPAPAPRRPAWEVALEELAELEKERARWVEEGRAAEYVDRVSDVARAYLGRRYGFDGLESTTDEVVEALSTSRHPELPMTDVVTLLSDCDLVKFARATPDAEMCADVLGQARRLVERSVPSGASRQDEPRDDTAEVRP